MANICKYCLETCNDLLNPCSCKNGVCYPCLLIWLSKLYNSGKAPICEICKLGYHNDLIEKILNDNPDRFTGPVIDNELEYVLDYIFYLLDNSTVITIDRIS